MCDMPAAEGGGATGNCFASCFLDLLCCTELNVAFPWYGYDFVCHSLTPGATCAASPGFLHRTLGLGEILDLHQAVGRPPITLHNDSVSKSFEYTHHHDQQGANSMRQRRLVTFDDDETIKVKMAAVLAQGVGGVGVWTADTTHRISSIDTSHTAAAMWGAVANVTARSNDSQ